MKNKKVKRMKKKRLKNFLLFCWSNEREPKTMSLKTTRKKKTTTRKSKQDYDLISMVRKKGALGQQEVSYERWWCFEGVNLQTTSDFLFSFTEKKKKGSSAMRKREEEGKGRKKKIKIFVRNFFIFFSVFSLVFYFIIFFFWQETTEAHWVH